MSRVEGDLAAARPNTLMIGILCFIGEGQGAMACPDFLTSPEELDFHHTNQCSETSATHHQWHAMYNLFV